MCCCVTDFFFGCSFVNCVLYATVLPFPLYYLFVLCVLGRTAVKFVSVVRCCSFVPLEMCFGLLLLLAMVCFVSIDFAFCVFFLLECSTDSDIGTFDIACLLPCLQNHHPKSQTTTPPPQSHYLGFADVNLRLFYVAFTCYLTFVCTVCIALLLHLRLFVHVFFLVSLLCVAVIVVFFILFAVTLCE